MGLVGTCRGSALPRQTTYIFISKLGGTVATQRSTGAAASRLELIISWSEVRILPEPIKKARFAKRALHRLPKRA
jgi:hypothetical protein